MGIEVSQKRFLKKEKNRREKESVLLSIERAKGEQKH